MNTLNISITQTMREWINAQVASGSYANASDYMRDLIRYDQREREALNLALMDGEKSGTSKRKISTIVATAKKKLKNGSI